MTTKFSTGAFVFFRRGNVTLMTPDEIRVLAQRMDIDDCIVPKYAGDRMAIFRAMRTMVRKVARDGWLCRPIKRDKKEIVCGVVRERKNEIAETVDHNHEATFTWKKSCPDRVMGNHEVSLAVNEEYQTLRGKIHGDDWTATVTSYLIDKCAAVSVREEGIVYWVPPQSIPEVHKLNTFLASINIRVICCEIEAGDVSVVKEIAQSSLNDEIETFEDEVKKFDGKQRSTVYTLRIKRYEELRKRANLYKSALGVAVDRLESSLTDLETKVTTMLDLRGNMVVHADGTATERKKPKKLKGNKQLAAANGKCEHDDVDELGMCLMCMQEVC